MRRKLIKQGLGGCTVSLPIKWVRAQNLGPGDTVEVREEGQAIVMSKGEASRRRKKSVEFESADIKQVRSVLASLYKAGYDEMELKFGQDMKAEQINTIVNTFTGLEVVQQSKREAVIRSFLKIEEEEVENLIIKFLQSVNNLAQEILSGDVDKGEAQVLVRQNLRKLRDLSLRSIHTTKHGGDKSYDYYDFVTILEKTGSELYMTIGEEPKDFRKVAEYLDELYRCYLKKDFKKSNALWQKVSKYRQEMRSKPGTGRGAVHAYRLSSLLIHLSSRLVGLSS